MTASIRIAMADLAWKQVAIVHPGSLRYPLAEQVEAVPLSELACGGALFPATSA